MKQYKNFLNHKIAFRCDYADIPKIGSGHLYRSIIIAKFLQKKFSLNPKQIVFIVKTKGKYLKNPKIISNHNFKIISLNANVEDYSKEEAYYLKKIKANLLIIDRLGKVTKTFYETIKNNYKKFDTVLFSCGGSSFSNFKNYMERGEYFKEMIVGEIS